MSSLFHKIAYKIQSRINASEHARKQQLFKSKILDFHAQHPSNDKDIQQALNYLSSNTLTTFFDTFQEKYVADNIKVFHDASIGLPYTLLGDKKLFFKRSNNKRTVQLMFNGLLMEQDPASPHCYIDSEFSIEAGDVLADVGCAESLFSLMNIEKLSQVYLFEQDPEWREALEATFAPWKEKTVIIPKFVSNRNTDNKVCLDDFFRNQTSRPNFYKINVEGAEDLVLDGMKEILTEQPLKIALCTYHHQDDFEKFSRFFSENGFSHRPNPGVVVYQNDMTDAHPPFFRKCLINNSSVFFQKGYS